jgi:hypothetical protein
MMGQGVLGGKTQRPLSGWQVITTIAYGEIKMTEGRRMCVHVSGGPGKTWTDKTGQTWKLKDMTTRHIENCINYLESCRVSGFISLDGEVYAEENDEVAEMIMEFKDELERG